MKRILLLFLVLFLTSVSANYGNSSRQGDINESLVNLSHSADSLNTLIKRYDEKIR